MVNRTLKKIVRDSFIIANGYQRRFLKRDRGNRVITFHEVKNRDRFREKIEWLKEKFEILTLEEVLNGGGKGSSNAVAVTFDDGYSSWHECAAPVLEELKVPAVFFVSSGFVGLEGEKVRQFLKNCFLRSSVLSPLTRSQVVDISNHPLFEIGSHTRNHINLGIEHSMGVLRDEIDGDIDNLQSLTGKRVRWLAYPFGGKEHFCARSKEYLKESQIEGAFTILPGFVEGQKDWYEIGRDSLDEDSSTRLWEGWLSGGYDIKGKL